MVRQVVALAVMAGVSFAYTDVEVTGCTPAGLNDDCAFVNACVYNDVCFENPCTVTEQKRLCSDNSCEKVGETCHLFVDGAEQTCNFAACGDDSSTDPDPTPNPYVCECDPECAVDETCEKRETVDDKGNKVCLQTECRPKDTLNPCDGFECSDVCDDNQRCTDIRVSGNGCTATCVDEAPADCSSVEAQALCDNFNCYVGKCVVALNPTKNVCYATCMDAVTRPNECEGICNKSPCTAPGSICVEKDVFVYDDTLPVDERCDDAYECLSKQDPCQDVECLQYCQGGECIKKPNADGTKCITECEVKCDASLGEELVTRGDRATIVGRKMCDDTCTEECEENTWSLDSSKCLCPVDYVRINGECKPRSSCPPPDAKDPCASDPCSKYNQCTDRQDCINLPFSFIDRTQGCKAHCVPKCRDDEDLVPPFTLPPVSATCTNPSYVGDNADYYTCKCKPGYVLNKAGDCVLEDNCDDEFDPCERDRKTNPILPCDLVKTTPWEMCENVPSTDGTKCNAAISQRRCPRGRIPVSTPYSSPVVGESCNGFLDRVQPWDMRYHRCTCPEGLFVKADSVDAFLKGDYQCVQEKGCLDLPDDEITDPIQQCKDTKVCDRKCGPDSECIVTLDARGQCSYECVCKVTRGSGCKNCDDEDCVRSKAGSVCYESCFSKDQRDQLDEILGNKDLKDKIEKANECFYSDVKTCSKDEADEATDAVLEDALTEAFTAYNPEAAAESSEEPSSASAVLASATIVSASLVATLVM